MPSKAQMNRNDVPVNGHESIVAVFDAMVFVERHHPGISVAEVIVTAAGVPSEAALLDNAQLIERIYEAFPASEC